MDRTQSYWYGLLVGRLDDGLTVDKFKIVLMYHIRINVPFIVVRKYYVAARGQLAAGPISTEYRTRNHTGTRTQVVSTASRGKTLNWLPAVGRRGQRAALPFEEHLLRELPWKPHLERGVAE